MLEFILADQLADLLPQYWYLVVKNGNLTFLLLKFIWADEVADLPPHQSTIHPLTTATLNMADLPPSTVHRSHEYCYTKLGRYTGRSTPPILASSGQEWQFYISTVRDHIGRSSGRSTPQYWHLVVKNCNFIFLLLELM